MQHYLEQKTPLLKFLQMADSVASLSSARPSQRAERSGFAERSASLRYVLIPWETMLGDQGPNAKVTEVQTWMVCGVAILIHFNIRAEAKI